MNRREYCHRLAAVNEALYDNEQELKEVNLKIIMEDDPDRKDWFTNAQERLLQERSDLEEKREALESEGYSDSDD